MIDPGSELSPGYSVLEHLSRGRHLDVYEVWSETRACHCVAKVLRPDMRADADAQRRLRNEGRLLARLTHPHVVRAYETVSGQHGTVVVLETLGGETLSHLIARRTTRLSAGELAWLGVHLCSAVHYLHGEGILHLDLKPSNVINEQGHAKVIDLSLARAPGRVRAGLGTAQYLPPEQARGGEVGPAADVWGVGAVLYAAATGNRPFGAPDNGAAFEQLRRRATRVRTMRRLPAPLADAIDGCLEPEPADRPTLIALADAVTAVAAES
jgi:eukaryotic-like serine/threonine-protein kinase